MATSAFIVIDVQNDFCPEGALAVADGDAVVAPINAMMADFDHVILTKIGTRKIIPALPASMMGLMRFQPPPWIMVSKPCGLTIAFKAASGLNFIRH